MTFNLGQWFGRGGSITSSIHNFKGRICWKAEESKGFGEAYHHVSICNCIGADEKLISQGALAMINMCNDRKIANHIGRHL